MLLCALAACGGGPGGPDGATPPGDAGAGDAGAKDGGAKDAGIKDAGVGPVPIAQWCAAKAWAECARDVRCLALQPSQLEGCASRKRFTCTQDGYTAAAQQGRLQYFSTQAAQCLNAYGEGACTGTPPSCAGLLQGLVPADGGCAVAEECQQGSYCLLYDGRCPHRCWAYQPVGAPCNNWERQCDARESACMSVDGGAPRCEPRRGVGEGCALWSDCREDLACISAANNEYRCVKRLALLGESCGEVSGYPVCELEAFCRQPAGQPSGTCQRRQGLGGACSGYSACLPGLRCSSTYATGVCEPLGRAGETCSGYGDCGGELYCAVRDALCKPVPGDGGSCGLIGGSYQCQADHFCDYAVNVCLPRRALGDRCTYDEGCLSGACAYGPLSDGGLGNRCTQACRVDTDGGI